MEKLYAYQRDTFTEQDVDDVLKVIKSLASEFTCMEVINAMCTLRGAVGTSLVLNSLDHLVMNSEIVELTAGTECFGQDRRYRK